MYYRLAFQRSGVPLDRPAPWQWKSTALSSRESLVQLLRLYRAFPPERLRVFSASSREGLEEQLSQENSGGGSPSVTVACFLQQEMLPSPGAPSAGEAQGQEETTSIAVFPRTREDECGGVAHTLGERERSSLEWRRLDHECGPGGDHDLPSHFALPHSTPQVLAWTRLLGRVRRGEIELE